MSCGIQGSPPSLLFGCNPLIYKTNRPRLLGQLLARTLPRGSPVLDCQLPKDGTNSPFYVEPVILSDVRGTHAKVERTGGHLAPMRSLSGHESIDDRSEFGLLHLATLSLHAA